MRPIYSNRITTRYHLRALMSPTLIPRTRDLTDLSSQPWYSRNYSWISFFKLQFLCRQNITLKSSTQCTIGFEGKMKLLCRTCLQFLAAFQICFQDILWFVDSIFKSLKAIIMLTRLSYPNELQLCSDTIIFVLLLWKLFLLENICISCLPRVWTVARVVVRNALNVVELNAGSGAAHSTTSGARVS